EIDNRAGAYGPGEGTVLPDGIGAQHEITSEQIDGGGFIVAGNRDQFHPERVSHVFDEAGFAAAGGAFQQQGKFLPVGMDKYFGLSADGPVVRCGSRVSGVSVQSCECCSHWKSLKSLSAEHG